MIQDEALRDMCRGLSGAIKSGMALSAAFETLSAAPAYGRYLARAAELTAGGTPMHEAFSQQGIFPPVFTALLRAGEEGGKTDQFLDLYADSLDVRIDFRRSLGRVLIYPAFAVLLGLGLFAFMSLKAIPVITAPLTRAGAPVHGAASLLAAAGTALGQHWLIALVSLAALWLAGKALLRTGPFRKLLSLAAHWLPGFRYATAESRLYYVYTTIGLLLRAGFPLTAMMDVMLQFSADDPVLSRRFSRAAKLLAGGGNFCLAMGGILTPDDQRSMQIAEGAGRLDETLLRLAEQHRGLHLHRLKTLATYTTIAVTVALAPLCFMLIMSVIKPVFSGIGGASADGRRPQGEQSSDMMSPEDAATAKAHAHFIPVENDTSTAVFNATYGAAIMNFISRYSAGPAERPAGQQAPPVKVGPPNEEEREHPQVVALPSPAAPRVSAPARTTAIPRLKKRSGPIAPTDILSGQ